VGDGAAEARVLEPRLLVGDGARRAPALVEVEKDVVGRQPRPEIDGAHAARLLLERGVVGRAYTVDEVEAALAQARERGVLVADDLDGDGVEIRELRPGRVALPVVRVASEADALAGRDRLEGEGPGGDYLLRVGGDAVSLAEVAGAEVCFEAVARKHGDVDEVGLGRGDLLGEDELEAARVESARLDGALAEEERVADDRRGLGVDGAHRELDVGGRKRLAVGELELVAQGEFDGAAVFEQAPALGEAGRVGTLVVVELDEAPGGEEEGDDEVWLAAGRDGVEAGGRLGQAVGERAAARARRALAGRRSVRRVGRGGVLPARAGGQQEQDEKESERGAARAAETCRHASLGDVGQEWSSVSCPIDAGEVRGGLEHECSPRVQN
jgi:hypothetical protein